MGFRRIEMHSTGDSKGARAWRWLAEAESVWIWHGHFVFVDSLTSAAMAFYLTVSHLLYRPEFHCWFSVTRDGLKWLASANSSSSRLLPRNPSHHWSYNLEPFFFSSFFSLKKPWFIYYLFILGCRLFSNRWGGSSTAVGSASAMDQQRMASAAWGQAIDFITVKKKKYLTNFYFSTWVIFKKKKKSVRRLNYYYLETKS